MDHQACRRKDGGLRSLRRAPRRRGADPLEKSLDFALRFADCCDKWLDAASTSFDTRPVSMAARGNIGDIGRTSVVPFEACCTLRAISWVAAPAPDRSRNGRRNLADSADRVADFLDGDHASPSPPGWH